MSDESTSFEVVIAHLRVQQRMIAAGAIWCAMAPFLFVAIGKLVGPTGGGPPSWLGAALAAIVGVGVFGAALGHRSAKRRARLEITREHAVVIEGDKRREIAKRSIENAMLVEGKRGHELLELNLTGGDSLLLDFGGSDGARAALAKLALANERNVTRIRMYPRSQQLLTQIAGGLVGGMVAGIPIGLVASVLGSLAPFVLIACMIPAMIYSGRWFTKLLPELSVGADGVAVHGGMSTAVRFLPHDQVDHVAIVRRDLPKNPGAHVVELSTTDGDKHVLVAYFAAQGAAAEALKLRIEQAIAERRAIAATLPAFAQLERQGRPTAAWLDELRGIGRQQADYRRAQLTNEQLDTLLTDGATSAEHRLGAAVVLAARGDSDATQRIRIASEASADPAVSKALLAVAEGEAEEEAIAEAIEAAGKRAS